MTHEVVGRLHQALVEALGRRSSDEPLTVAEVYERLVPYREVRGQLGVELIGDYEHALLRLLAGEGSLLRVESPHARAAIRHEAASDFPSVGVFRQFAESTVAVDASLLESRLDAGHGGAPDGVDEPGSEPTATPRPEPAGAPPGDARPAESPLERAAPSDEPAPGWEGEAGPVGGDPGTGTGGGVGSTCRFCERALPEDRAVRFCPYCGGDQRLRPCPRCDSVVESGWRYCVRCGQALELE